ncbi:hypothetical protein ppKF707_1509 [Metapseudomonas furukawaii]|uniref:Uncharacterized protein n=1 Tax=Metapseudomonas furukawaii TaxID=1149133 RepID=A0AAD1FIH8_METFU|nr:hypothetical protein ppKF707_1509 [Pseudomonas furukawaii]BAU77427.1 hypothetical protein KF707C_p380 [Pseudomonas furukawaii]
MISRNLEELAGFALILLIAIEAIAFFSLLTGEDNGGQSDLWWLFKATSMGAAALWSLALLAN